MSALNTKDLQRIFKELDKNGDGLVSLEEVNRLLERTDFQLITPDEMELYVGKPSLDFYDFLLFYRSISNRNEVGDQEVEEDLVKAFKVFDLNDDGFISCEELQNVLGRLELWNETNGRDCSSMIRAYDTNFDGRLDFEEFKNMMLPEIS